jgi:hypothetical protein
MKESVE